MFMYFLPYIQLFRRRLSHNSTKAHAKMPIGIMGSNGLALFRWGSRGLARRIENAWIHVSVLLPSLRRNTLGFNQSSAKPSLPIITRDIVASTFTLLQDNLSRNSYIEFTFVCADNVFVYMHALSVAMFTYSPVYQILQEGQWIPNWGKEVDHH